MRMSAGRVTLTALFIVMSGCTQSPVDDGPQLKAYPANYDVTGGNRFVHFGASKAKVLYGVSAIRVLELKTGAELSPLMRHNRIIVNCAVFDPKGERLVTACNDSQVRIWSSEGKLLLPPMKHGKDGLNAAQFSPDGKVVVSLSWDNSVIVWNSETGNKMHGPIATGKLYDVAFSPDGRWFVTAGARAQVWETATGKPSFGPLEHKDQAPAAVVVESIIHVAVSPNGRLIATAGGGGKTCIWDAKSGNRIQTLARHGDHVRHVAFSFDGRRVATASFDGTARLWDTKTGKPATPWLKHGERVNHVCFSPDAKRVVTSSDDGTARIWDASNGKQLLNLTHDDGQVFHAVFSPDGKNVVTESVLGIRCSNSVTGQLVACVGDLAS